MRNTIFQLAALKNSVKLNTLSNYSELLKKAVEINYVSEKDIESRDKELTSLNPINSESSSETVTSFTNKKVRRNSPCPCGSGKKFKHCHGNN